MPDPIPVPIAPPPGVVKTETGKVAAGRWIDGDKIHFVRGLPQKLGGWTKQTTAATLGQPRASHAWRDNASNQFLAVGTYRKLYAYDSSFGQNDITPFRATGTLGNNPFTTTNGSSIVAVAHNGHGLNPGDTIIFSGATAVGGITPNGTFTVLTVTDANNYKFDFGSNASSGATGGGAAVAFSYEIPVGTELGAYGLGWGVGSWGINQWGNARGSSTIFIEPRVWSLDHFGQILLASYNGGAIYSFDPTASQPWPRAGIVTQAPADCRAMFVTAERFVVALRAGMVIAWCTQGDYTVWTPSAANTANSRTLTVGTKLVAGRVLGPFVSLIWSDAAAYVMQWTGNKYVHDTRLLATECGLIAPGAAVTVNGVAYWMGADNFFTYDGSVHPIANVEDVRKFVFDGLDKTRAPYQCHAVYDPKYNEIYFYYTVAGGANPTNYVIYAINDACWTPGALTRCSGTHFQQGDTRPYQCDADGNIYLHNNGNDANGAALPWSLTLAPYALNKSLELCEIDGMETDFKDQAGTITFTLATYDRLGDPAPQDSETETVSPGDQLIDWRSSGRYLSLSMSSSDLGSYFRWGVPQAYVKPLGERR